MHTCDNNSKLNGATKPLEMILSIQESRQDDCSPLKNENRQPTDRAQVRNNLQIDTTLKVLDKDIITLNNETISSHVTKNPNELVNNEYQVPSPTESLRTVDTLDEEVEEAMQIDDLEPPNYGTDLEAVECFPKLNSDQLKASKVAERYNYWRSHSHAVGLGPISWSDQDNEEVIVCRIVDEENQDLPIGNIGPVSNTLSSTRNFVSNYICNSSRNHRSTVCCKRFGRVGNMVVLKERNSWIPVSMQDPDEDTPDVIENASKITHSSSETQRHFDIVLGPYWPKLCFFTLPLILGVSALAAVRGVFRKSNEESHLIKGVWIASTTGWVTSLLYTSLVNPGILIRHKDRPAKNWRWNDNCQSYIPPDAVFEPDCNVVIEKYDHTCIYTGTAIGKNNMRSFLLFIFFTVFCTVENIVVLISNI